MQDFIFSTNFPKSKIDFDLRFSDTGAYYDYLFNLKCPSGFVCKKSKNEKASKKRQKRQALDL